MQITLLVYFLIFYAYQLASVPDYVSVTHLVTVWCLSSLRPDFKSSQAQTM